MYVGGLITLFFILCRTCRGVEFILEPTDTVATERKESFFYCIVRNLSNDQELAWYQDETQVSTNNQVLVDPDKYIADYDKVYGQYRLVIQSVSRKDGLSRYSCRIKQNGASILKSREVKLLVQEVPGEFYPFCLPLRSNYLEGDTAVVSCKSEVTIPAVNLIFNKNEKIVDQSLQLDYSEHDYVYLRHTFIAQSNDNGKIFKCSMTSPSMQSIRNCSTSPLNVHYKPVVSIQGPTELEFGRETFFICHSKSNPPAFSYSWMFIPSIQKDRYRTETSNQILRLVNPSEDLLGVEIICIVSNSVGNGTYEFVLRSVQESTTHFENITTQIQFQEEPSPPDKPADDNQNWFTMSTHNPYITFGAIAVFLIAAFIPLCVIKLYVMERKPSSICKHKQLDAYSEPKDQIALSFPLSEQIASWRRSVGVQVNEGTEAEPMYVEIPADRYIIPASTA